MNLQMIVRIHMSFRVDLSGSVAEDTKVYAPDEIDVMCIFDIGKICRTEYCGNRVRFHPGTTKGWSDLCSYQGYLDIRLVAQAFYILIDFKIRAAIEKNEFNDHANICPSRYSLCRSDKISHLCLLWTGSVFDNMVVHVDLVPCFECLGFNPTMPIPLGGSAGETFYALAKGSRFNYLPQIEFPISFCAVERRILKNLPSYVKEGLIFAKALRIASICRPGLNFEDLDIEEDINCDDIITSYMLKNCLFNLLQDLLYDPYQKCGEDSSIMKRQIPKNRYAWADAIYEYLERRVCSYPKRLPLWYNNQASLLDCSDCNEKEYACCQKRKIIINIVLKIRKWLKEVHLL